MIRFKKGYKYQLTSPWRWKLRGNFTIVSDYRNQYYWISKERREIGAYVGCAWDGASGFPDFDWIMEASLGHDILHWLIEKGIIPESENDQIDAELAEIIRERGRSRIPDWLLRFRAWYVQKATNLVDGKLGKSKPEITIPRQS